MKKKSDIVVDYDNSILSVSNSILKHFGVKSEYSTHDYLDNILSSNYRNVVLVILDGLGVNVITKNLPEDSFLRQHVVAHISSVFPPTTTAATTAYHSGLPPIASGWLGWMNYFPQYDKIIEVFRNKDYYSGEKQNTLPPSENILKYTSIYEKILEANPNVEYYKVFPDFEEDGCASFKEECEKISNCIARNTNKKIISAYWTEPDHTMHEQGVTSENVKNIIEDIDKNLQQLSKKLKDTVLIISADHGMKDVEMMMLNDNPDICKLFKRPPSLESRFVNFFIKEGKHQEFTSLFSKYYGDDFVLFNKQELLASNILGKGPTNPLIENFLGDYQAIAVGDKTLHYTTGERALKIFKGEHAGYSQEEMEVPLIVATYK